MGSGSGDGMSHSEKLALNESRGRKTQAWNMATDYANKGYDPYTGQRNAGFDPAETQAHQNYLDFAGQKPGYFGTSMDAVKQNLGFTGAYQKQNMQGITGQELQEGIAMRMNPYEQQVIDNTMGDYNRARMMTKDATAAQALGGGAFGGSRHGVADAMTNEEFARQAGGMASQLRYQGYGQALGGVEAERARLQGMRMTDAEAYANDQARATQMRSQSAQQYAALGGLQDADTVSRIQMQQNVGGERRGMEQANRDFQYEQFMNAKLDEADKVAMMQAAAAGTAYTPAPRQKSKGNRGSSMMGGAAAGAAAGAQTGNPYAALWGAGIGAVAGGILH